jgi:deoxyribodipyrimidine photo-lyase
VAGYNETHNQVAGDATSGLSPYIRHGLLSLREVRDSVVGRFGPEASRPFVTQLLWRVYWYLIYPERGLGGVPEPAPEREPEERPDLTAGRPRARGRGRERAERRSEAVPDRVPLAPPYPHAPTPPYSPAPSGYYCIDEPLRLLKSTGFITYQARLWVASFLLHLQGADWREGYRLFQEHLLDADPVVNELSWRWVSGELTGQPYYFNRERVKQSTGGEFCVRCTAYRCAFEGSVASVAERARKPGVR